MYSTCSCTDTKMCPYVHSSRQEEEDSDEITSTNSNKHPVASAPSKYVFKTKRQQKANESWKGQAHETSSSSSSSQTEDDDSSEEEEEAETEKPTTTAAAAETTNLELKKQLKKLQKQLHRSERQPTSLFQNDVVLWPRAGHRPSMHYVAARQRQTHIGDNSTQPPDLTDVYRMKPKLSVHQRCNQWLDTQEKSSDDDDGESSDVAAAPQRAKKHRYHELIQPISSASSSKRVEPRNKPEQQQQRKKQQRQIIEECPRHDHDRGRKKTRRDEYVKKPHHQQQKRRKTTQPAPTAHHYESQPDNDKDEEECADCEQLLHYQNKVKQLQEKHRHHQQQRAGHFISKTRKPVTSSWVVLQAVNVLERTNSACTTLIHRTVQCELGKPDFTVEEVKETLKWMVKNGILAAKRDNNGIKMYTTKQVARGPNKRKMKAARSVFHTEGHLQRFEFPPIPSYEQVYGSDDSRTL